MLTLIAFKPEKLFWDRGDPILLSSLIIRENNLTEELIDRVDQLKIPQMVEHPWGRELDFPFHEFHVFQSVGSSFLEEMSVEDIREIVNSRKNI